MLTRINLLERVTPGSICAELGTFRGDFAHSILTICRPALLYIVDTFDGVVESGDQDGLNATMEDMGEMLPKIGARFIGKPVEVVKGNSSEWLRSIRPDSLDFVYIDTTHVMAQTLKELECSRKAVRAGGLICGHDYDHKFFPGVVQAVSLFCKMFDLNLELYQGDKLASYLIVNKKD